MYTLADVAAHRTEDDCWMVIHGLVFDVTSLVPSHPGGGDLLLAVAGRDATIEFADEAKHPGQRGRGGGTRQRGTRHRLV